MQNNRIAFIGSGNMASALISGLIADGTAPSDLIASDPDASRRAGLAASAGIRTLDDNLSAAREADVLVLAVKPQVLKHVISELRPALDRQRPLVISIVAGIRCAAIKDWSSATLPLVRAMPNTPAMIQVGASVLYAGAEVSAEQRNSAERILRAVGLVRWVDDEDLMDAVTALSGSGPAYFFLVMEAMETAAIELGLTEDTARLLTLQTALGAARMAIESSEHPAVLRTKVTSPGGTTERALQSFEQDGIREVFKRALTAARDRSIELSELLGGS
jgi:pyrroline-5-carboxylate reductase